MENQRQIDWDSAEGKQATERLRSFLRHIDKDAAQTGNVRKVVSLKGADGEELKIVTWGKP